MSVIFYNSINNEAAEKLEKILDTKGLGEKVERFQSIEELSNGLSRTNRNQHVAVIHIGAMQEFNQILSIKRLLNDMRIILILPDRSAEIVSAGYKLYPRFISYSDSDFNDVAIVLRRMIALMEQKSIITEMPSSRFN